MKSESLKFFGLPDADYDIEPRIDHHGLRRISFRSKGYPLQELDMGGAAKLRELMANAGETENVKLLEAAIEKSKVSSRLRWHDTLYRGAQTLSMVSVIPGV